MTRFYLLIGAVAAAALLSVSTANAAGAPSPDCAIGGANNTGSVTLAISGSTATAAAVGWSFCGEATQASFSFTNGYSQGCCSTSASVSLAAGQCVSVTGWVGSPSNGLAFGPYTAGPVCAASTSGGGGGGTTSPPTVRIFANPTSVAYGGTSAITWSVSDTAASCSIAGGGLTGSVPANSAGLRTAALTANPTAVRLSCSNAGGAGSGSVSITVTGTPPPLPPPPALQPQTFDGGWSETLYTMTGFYVGTRSGTGPGPYTTTTTTSALPEPTLAWGSTVAWTSTDGCKTLDKYESGHSGLFGSLVYRFHLTTHWCWWAGKITAFSEGTSVSDVDSSQSYHGLIGSGNDWFYSWNGNPMGGHYRKAQGRFDNCILKYGCIGSTYPWVQVWVNANGSWKEADGGGA